MMSRQVDIPYTDRKTAVIPRDVPGQATGDEYVHFRWANSLKSTMYDVVVESHTGMPRFRSIGALRPTMKLPNVIFGPYAKIGVLPKTAALPSFEGHLRRGGTYVVPDTAGKNGRFYMETHGMAP